MALNSNEAAFNNYLNSKNIKFENISLKDFITKNNLDESEFINILLKKLNDKIEQFLEFNTF